jgi:hypothetical protein
MPPPFFIQVKCDSKHFFIQFVVVVVDAVGSLGFHILISSSIIKVPREHFRSSVTNGLIALHKSHFSLISNYPNQEGGVGRIPFSKLL